MNRSYYSKPMGQFLQDEHILGKLTKNPQFSSDGEQRSAWMEQIDFLKKIFKNLKSGHIIFEYVIPRMGKRADVILIYSGLVFIIEFKIGMEKYEKSALDQVWDYALDLKNFQKESHAIQLVPILVATNASDIDNTFEQDDDGVFKPLCCNKNTLLDVINHICTNYTTDNVKPIIWEESTYMPTPTIIELAQALYRGHSVEDISRRDADATNLTNTTDAINNIISTTKKKKLKSICFVTGVPGAGKTLVGLNVASIREKLEQSEHAVFLSGNGPLVDVLQEALAQDQVYNSKVKLKISDARRSVKVFIQNIHHFRDEYLRDKSAPDDHIVIFDEAQRAWDKKHTSKFMKQKREVLDFNMSEPEFLIDIMNRHSDWAVIICLIGSGQEINTGEAGLSEWFSALNNKFHNWNVYTSTNESINSSILQKNNHEFIDALHLKTSIRSYRNKHVSGYINAILDQDIDKALELSAELKTREKQYPIVLTRDLNTAKKWMRDHAKGSRRYGLVASSGAYRLRPFGIFINSEINAKNWFLKDSLDVRSSFYMEYVATEFHVQGLELDWICVGWDGDFRFSDGEWTFNQFRGSKWMKINKKSNMNYLKNAYRVLLTRARQGMIIFIPKGDASDHTRDPKYYDETYEYLKKVGIQEI